MNAIEALCAAARDVSGPARPAVESVVGRIAPLASDTERAALVDAAVARLVGLGSLAAMLADPDVDEVLVNGDQVWVERAGELAAAGHIDADEVAVVLERILAPIGRRLDLGQPIVDARLVDGSRLCAVIAPVAVDGTCVAIRRSARRAMSIAAFADDAVATVLGGLVAARANIVVSGATSSGKTTLLGALVAALPPTERIIVIEDTTELDVGRGRHAVRLEARRPSADGVTPIDLAALVRTALRLRPDRIVVGEVRGDEVLAMVLAMNTGHDGSLATVHANSALDALHRLETLIVQAAPGWPLRAVREQLTRSIDAIVHLDRGGNGRRRVREVVEVVVSAESPAVRPVVADGEVVGTLTRSRR
jgi:pilus assembly protein CpaF